jgi:hypothetical protein
MPLGRRTSDSRIPETILYFTAIGGGNELTQRLTASGKPNSELDLPIDL